MNRLCLNNLPKSEMRPKVCMNFKYRILAAKAYVSDVSEKQLQVHFTKVGLEL